MTTERSGEQWRRGRKRSLNVSSRVVLGLLSTALAARAQAAEPPATAPPSPPTTVATATAPTAAATSAPPAMASGESPAGSPAQAPVTEATVEPPAPAPPRTSTTTGAADEDDASPLVWAGSFGIAAAVGAAGVASGLLLAASAEDDSSSKWAAIGLYIGAGVALVTGLSLVIVGASADAPASTLGAPAEGDAPDGTTTPVAPTAGAAPTGEGPRAMRRAPALALTPAGAGLLLHGWF